MRRDRSPPQPASMNGSIGETTWGLNLCWIVMRKNEEAYWVPFPREWGASGFARMSHAGVITGLRGLQPRRRFGLVPFFTPRRPSSDGGGGGSGFSGGG